MISCSFENGDKVGLRHVVVGVILIKEGKILLEKRGTFRGKPILENGKWALIGGYLDRDETLVDCCKREAMEETGWKIDNLKLFKVVDNPNRPNDNSRQNVSFVFIADAISQIPTESEEVSELKWFDINYLPPDNEIAFDFSEALLLYKKYLEEHFSIPVVN